VRIVVNHLTRMSHGYICAAGIDLETGAHIRPTSYGRLSQHLLTKYGGPFDLGNIVDLGRVVHEGKPPETEDHRFEPKQARRLRLAAADEFWERLTRTAESRLSSIFGPVLTRAGAFSYTVPLGAGQASLGCLAPPHRPELYLKPRPGRSDQVRMRLSDGEIEADAGVTDLRLYDDQDNAPDQRLVADIAAWMTKSRGVILSVGLSRPFGPDPDAPPVHWLQVNNIHFVEAPLWRPRLDDDLD
jgi:hypothetical protein